jgi:uncharacterized protein YbbK (DUF523 family)
MFDKILISRCFLGENVRYNGETIPLNHPLLTLWQQQNRFIAICPEVSGGLPVPREPAEQQSGGDKIITMSNINVSAQFKLGAEHALALCQQYNIRFALLKESSPSCGSTLIYDGSFSNKKIAGQGVTSKLLTQHGIKVFSENSLAELAVLLDEEELI